MKVEYLNTDAYYLCIYDYGIYHTDIKSMIKKLGIKYKELKGICQNCDGEVVNKNGELEVERRKDLGVVRGYSKSYIKFEKEEDVRDAIIAINTVLLIAK